VTDELEMNKELLP
jgi:hypothetical protein